MFLIKLYYPTKGAKMPSNYVRTVRIGFAVTVLLGLVGGILLFKWYQDMLSCHTDRPPLISMGMTIDPSQSQQLIEQSRQFAFKHHFRFDVSYSDQQDNDPHIRMVGKDVEIIVRSPANPGGYEVRFYNFDCIHPVVASDIVDLVNDFKGFMSEIPNVTITEEK
jgi:hypothetical protein